MVQVKQNVSRIVCHWSLGFENITPAFLHSYVGKITFSLCLLARLFYYEYQRESNDSVCLKDLTSPDP